MGVGVRVTVVGCSARGEDERSAELRGESTGCGFGLGSGSGLPELGEEGTGSARARQLGDEYLRWGEDEDEGEGWG